MRTALLLISLLVLLSVGVFAAPLPASEMDGVLNSATDYYCEDASAFTKTCIIQDEQDRCHLEGKNIVCDAVGTAYRSALSAAELSELDSKGVPYTFSDDWETINITQEKEIISITRQKVHYQNPNITSTIFIDLTRKTIVHIGFNSDNFYVQDFYYGSGDVSIDTTVELSPDDKDVTLPQSSSLVGRWDFENNASPTGIVSMDMVIYDADHVHERYYFDGNDSYIRSTTDDSWEDYFKEDNTTGFTVSAYVYPDTDDKLMTILGSNYWANNLWFAVNTDNNKIYTYLGGVENTASTNTYDFLNKWTHVALVYNGTAYTWYVNGQQFDNVGVNGTPSFTGWWYSIGQTGTDANPSYEFYGDIEYVHLWNTTLTPTEIETIYNQTRFNTQGNTLTQSGIFTGAVLNASDNDAAWESYTFTTNKPSGTDVESRYRLGTSPDDCSMNVSWDSYSTWNTDNPRNITGTGRCLEYQFNLSTSNNSNTPELVDFNITYTFEAANESYGRSAIEQGVSDSELTNYTIADNKQVYIRLANSSQYHGTFDKFVKGETKRYAFNYDETTDAGFPTFYDIVPVFYVWQEYNMTYAAIKNSVINLIDGTYP